MTDVYFCWTLPAQSAFVTGDFNCWEVTVPMKKIDTRDGEVWIASKALPPGTCQYKCKPSRPNFLSLFSKHNNAPDDCQFETKNDVEERELEEKLYVE